MIVPHQRKRPDTPQLCIGMIARQTPALEYDEEPMIPRAIVPHIVGEQAFDER